MYKILKYLFFSIIFFPISLLSQIDCNGLPNKEIKIKEGCRYSGCFPTPLKPKTIRSMKPVYRVFQFDAQFMDNCKYDMTGSHWHKLMKIAWWPNSNDRSIRVGWRSDNSNYIDIGLYGHTNYGFSSVQMIGFRMDYYPILESTKSYELILAYHGIYMIAGNNAYGVYRKMFNKDISYSTGMARNAYFQGPDNAAAPHDMIMNVSNIYYDCQSNWDNIPNKGLFFSEFNESDNYTITALNNLTAPVPYGQGISSDMETVIINEDANITFFAGSVIKLRKGFHAKKDCIFRAHVQFSKDSLESINNLFSVVVPDSIIEYKDIDPNEFYKTTLYTDSVSTLDFISTSNKTYSIFPNPNTGTFNIQFINPNLSSIKIEVFNSIGNLVYYNYNVSRNKILIDIKSHPKGIYLVKLLIENKVHIEKIVYQ